MNSTAFLLLANSNAGIKEKEEMELTIGSLNIFIGLLGSSRLSDPAEPNPSASESETEVLMEYSEGSSSEVNSPVSTGEVQKGQIEKATK
jgi:hypothetical protein